MTEPELLPSDDALEDVMTAMETPDQPLGSDDWGITDFEQSTGEPLDRKLARERPDDSDRSRDDEELRGGGRP